MRSKQLDLGVYFETRARNFRWTIIDNFVFRLLVKLLPVILIHTDWKTPASLSSSRLIVHFHQMCAFHQTCTLYFRGQTGRMIEVLTKGKELVIKV